MEMQPWSKGAVARDQGPVRCVQRARASATQSAARCPPPPRRWSARPRRAPAPAQAGWVLIGFFRVVPPSCIEGALLPDLITPSLAPAARPGCTWRVASPQPGRTWRPPPPWSRAPHPLASSWVRDAFRWRVGREEAGVVSRVALTALLSTCWRLSELEEALRETPLALARRDGALAEQHLAFPLAHGSHHHLGVLIRDVCARSAAGSLALVATRHSPLHSLATLFTECRAGGRGKHRRVAADHRAGRHTAAA